MSMTGSGGEENCVEPSSNTEVAVGRDDPRYSSAATEVTEYQFSPLLRILSSKEIAPTILEYEKALLVMKEHDYAKGPERPEILKLSSLLEEPCEIMKGGEQLVDSLADINVLLNVRKDLLQFRESVSKRDENLVSSHQREVIGMQIDLIREQQEQLHDKDKELNTVRKDKEQLEARLERMERRLAILQKHSRSKYDNSELDSPQQPSLVNTSLDSIGSSSTPRIRAHQDSLVNSEQHPRSRSNSNDCGNRTGRSSRIPSHSSTPVPHDVQETAVSVGTGKRNAKRKLNDSIVSDTSSKKKRPKQNEIRTKLEYTGLNLLLPHQPRDFNDLQVLMTGSASLSNHCGDSSNNSDVVDSVSSPGASSHSDIGRGMVNGNDTIILVPSWKTAVMKANVTVEPSQCEDLSDESFNKRHRKPEEDEKRRKRWDVQRTRTLRNHEALLRKYNQKGSGGEKSEKKKEKITTFLPKLSEVEAIEIKDTLTVTAFGVPLPLLKPKEFEISWFDLEGREAKESVRTTRSMAKASTTTRTSVGSSADEDTK